MALSRRTLSKPQVDEGEEDVSTTPSSVVQEGGEPEEGDADVNEENTLNSSVDDGETQTGLDGSNTFKPDGDVASSADPMCGTEEEGDAIPIGVHCRLGFSKFRLRRQISQVVEGLARFPQRFPGGYVEGYLENGNGQGQTHESPSNALAVATTTSMMLIACTLSLIIDNPRHVADSLELPRSA